MQKPANPDITSRFLQIEEAIAEASARRRGLIDRLCDAVRRGDRALAWTIAEALAGVAAANPKHLLLLFGLVHLAVTGGAGPLLQS